MNRLNEIEARANAATEGPWMGIRYPDGFLGRVIGGNGFGVAEDFPEDADAEFIAHARADVPDMAAALRAVLDLHACIEPSLEQEREQGMRDWCGECDTYWPCETVETIRRYLGDDL